MSVCESPTLVSLVVCVDKYSASLCYLSRLVTVPSQTRVVLVLQKILSG